MQLRLRQFLPRRRWARWSLAILVLLGLVWLIAPRLVAPYVRGKLQAMIASRADVELRMDSLAYLPPFGVRVRDARLVAKENGAGEVEVLKVARLDLRLAKLPFGEGPLVIERIEVQQPEVHLILTEHGFVGARALAQAATQPATPPATQPAQPDQPQLPPGTKLSDMFELRQFAVRGGRVVVEDRTRPGSVPMVWSDLNANTDTTPTSHSAYTFDLKADHTDVAALSATGSFDLDALTLSVTDADLLLSTGPQQTTSGLPAQIQSILRQHQIAGKLGVRGKADLSFADLAAATFNLDVRVSDASADFAKANLPLDRLTIALNFATGSPSSSQPTSAPAATRPARPPVYVRLDQFEATSRASRLSLGDPKSKARPTVLIDRAANHWDLSDLTGLVEFDPVAKGKLAGRVDLSASAAGPLVAPAGQTVLQAADYRATIRPQHARLHVPKWPLPLEDVGGDNARIEIRPDVIAFKDIAARYGGDEILVRSARVPIPADVRDMKDGYAIEEIDSRVTFRHPNPKYPGKFDKVIQNLRPAGPFEIGGGSYFRVTPVRRDVLVESAAVASGRGLPMRKGDWFFSVSTDAGSLTVTGKRITLANISGDATVSNMLIDVPRLECEVFGGRGVASGKIVPRSPFLIQQGRVALREIDLANVAKTLQPDKPNDKLAGRGFLNFTFEGSLGSKDEVKAADLLRGKGEFEVIEGHFWTLPVIGQVASEARKGKNGLTLGEAAGVFRIAGRSVVLDNAAISSPALGLIGSGMVGFDKTVDLRIIAAPLGDWRDRIKQGGIPILSDVAGEIVGGVQKVLNAATSSLLYQFRVTGELPHPKIETIPAPVLTDPAALLFGRMLDEQHKRRLIESVRTEAR
jgi:hypothetical protein